MPGPDMKDPLTINLNRQTRTFLSKIPAESPLTSSLKNAPSRSALLASLSYLLAVPSLTLSVAQAFRPLLFDLCARWLLDDQNNDQKFIALCLLLDPHQELFPILSMFLRQAYHEDGPLAYILSTSLDSVDRKHLHLLLVAYYRLLQANRTLPERLLWSLTPLTRLIRTPHADAGIRFLAIRCYSLQSGMGETERVKMEKQVIGDVSERDCPITYGMDLDDAMLQMDGWTFPAFEVRRISDARLSIAQEAQDYYSNGEGKVVEPVESHELSPFTVNVHGVFLFRNHPATPPPSALVMTPGTIETLRQIALHTSLRFPILLTSEPSSGKSLLLSYLAGVLYPAVENQIITIHLADTSLDPRSLLGSYVSSASKPGNFEWKEGVLIRAMKQGKWVVLKDIDRGNAEVLGILKPLVESLGAGQCIGKHATMEVPGQGRVEASEHFAIFATRSVIPVSSGEYPKPIFAGAHKFYEVTSPSPTQDELRLIISSKFPCLTGTPSRAVIDLWESIRAVGVGVSGSRSIGTRELDKFCVRLEKLLPQPGLHVDVDFGENQVPKLSSVISNPTIREEVYLEARDVFFGSGTLTFAARHHTDRVASVVGDHLGLAADRQSWLLYDRIPEFHMEKDVNGRNVALLVGRSRIPAAQMKERVISESPPFAMHKPAILLLSRLSTAITLGEPVLLTGETGTGKTSIITHLASILRKPLVSLNLSNQTESSDLLGGFKPVDPRVPGLELQMRFIHLFGRTFSRRKNAKFEESVRKAVLDNKWKRAVSLWMEAIRLAKDKMRERNNEDETAPDASASQDIPRKRRKMIAGNDEPNITEATWLAFEHDVHIFDVQHVQDKGKFAFSFIEGPLIKALRSGDWILLDEINLASSETLECISALLQSSTSSITLTEQGSLEPIPRHPHFHMFACMNPATDVGKKDLPPHIRSRFTEIDVSPPDADRDTLLSIIEKYVGHCAVGDKGAIMDIAEFYMAVKQLSEERKIADGSNHRPHYSMRTLARALMWAADMAGTYSLRRAVWEGCLMAFTMALDSPSADLVISLARHHILARVRNQASLLSKEPLAPSTPEQFVKFGPFYLNKGSLRIDPVEDYILTPSVEKKLIDLARIITTRRFPILIEGPTSSGKTSAIEYLARRTGHRFVRINNHEHTDIQEYLGTYVSDPITGKLTFKDGLLVRALRNGDWIVLDELNLAPTDVLESLNRLLDDNRELVVPETQEVIRPHPHFFLFATQNPPGLYAGRKILSRAFRNRFLEVHFENVPQNELETILCQRCRIAPSYAQRIVSVFQELQKRRQSGRVFESKHGFATLRDLFRWAARDAVGYQELAENGFMLLAERTRRLDDKVVVKEVIESVMNVHIDESALYDVTNVEIDYTAVLGCPVPQSSQLVWTGAMKRLFFLVARALRFNEPVLLVGETGSGKTSVCQVYAEAISSHLHTVNCHQNTETADLIGGLRPVRNRASLEADAIREATVVLAAIGVSTIPPDFEGISSLVDSLLTSTLRSSYTRSLEDVKIRLRSAAAMFEWHDGPLVRAMQNGGVFLLDEISLADDSVLERLNSVLEPARSLVLAERGGDNLDIVHVQADKGFRLVATMNPGGDYGKKELSPALRNRFTEIWVPPVRDRRDLETIVSSLWKHDEMRSYTQPLLDFVEWLSDQASDASLSALRDILAWITFSNSVYQLHEHIGMQLNEIFHHAAHMTYLDGLTSFPQFSTYSAEALSRLKSASLSVLKQLVPLENDTSGVAQVREEAKFVQIGSFVISKGPKASVQNSFNLRAPTTLDNAMRVIRACQLSKPILLEGSPGVGKTSLVSALANISGYHLARINLSDQTDLVDLFGSDLPVEGGGPGAFAWKDAEFLRAMQDGHWVLLDEMNLAPQTILEGLNSVLDHRGSVYIPELGQSFHKHPSFRIFAAQNPLYQGGGRKGLPKSFLNRFTKVYVEELSPYDLLLVCHHLFPDYPVDLLREMITFNTRLTEEVVQKRSFGRDGGPWEFNLRDVIRWGTLLQDRVQSPTPDPADHLQTVYLQRFRTESDRFRVTELFANTFNLPSPPSGDRPRLSITASHVQVGSFFTDRWNYAGDSQPSFILQTQLQALEALCACVSNHWLVILTGRQQSGKTGLVRFTANVTGNVLHQVSMTNATDTMDILGSFEQVDFRVQVFEFLRDVLSFVERLSRSAQYLHLHDIAEYRTLKKSLASQLSPDDFRGILNTADTLLCGFGGLPVALDQERGSLVNRFHALTKTPDIIGRFEWVDGPLIRALKQGHWLLLDDANLCNPSILDRLNSLCETGGVLTLSERGHTDGEVLVIKPHPNFRLFMSVDPRQGELSRAMRNRGVEIALLDQLTSEDRYVIMEHHRLPLCEAFSTTTSFGQYEMLRRGLFTSVVLTSSAPTLPASNLITQDCACKALVDHNGPLSTPLSPDSETALLFFAVQSVPPGYLAYFIRLIHTLSSLTERPILSRVASILRSLPAHSISSVFSCLREKLGHTLEIPSDFLAFQPMDPSLNPLLCYQGSNREEISTKHTRNLLTLYLYVHVYIGYERERARQLKNTSKTSPKLRGISTHKTSTVPHAITESEDLLNVILATGQAILGQLPADLTDALCENIRTVTRLLDYGHYLDEIIDDVRFDHSAVQVLSRWIVDAVRNAPPIFNQLIIQAKKLEDAVSLSSGLGLHDVWFSFLYEKRSGTLRVSTNELGLLSSFRDNSSGSGLVRSRIFQLLALWTLPAALTDGESRILEDLNGQVERLKIHHKDQAPELHDFDVSFFTLELNVLRIAGGIGDSSGTQDPESSTQFIQQVVDTVLKDDAQPLLRFVPYQHVLWASQSNKLRMPIVAEMQKKWLETLWSTNTIDIGPSILLRPFHLNATLSKCDWNMISLTELHRYRASLLSHARLTELLFNVHMSRKEQLTGFLVQCILMLFACFLTAGDGHILQVVNTLSRRADIGSSDTVRQLFHLMDQIGHPHFKSSAALALRSALYELARNPPINENSPFATLGHCWILFSRFVIELYVPDAPIDPAAIHRCTEQFWQQSESTTIAKIQLHKSLEKRLTGNGTNTIIRYLEGELCSIKERLSTVVVTPHRGIQGVEKLNTYWSEISQFLRQVVSPERLEALLAASDPDDQAMLLREGVFQQSITGFCQRLDTAYPDYDDISGPLTWCLHQMKLGIRLVMDRTSRHRDILGSLVEALISFPSILSSEAWIKEAVTKNSFAINAFAPISLSLNATAFEVSVGVDLVQLMPFLSNTYQQAVGLWLIDRAREEQSIKNGSSLYRRKDFVGDLSDAEQERLDFLELFPDFEDSLEIDTSPETQKNSSNQTNVIQPHHCRQISQLHHQLMHGGDIARDTIKKFQGIRRDLLYPVFESHFHELSDSLDPQSLHLQSSMLQDCLASLQRDPIHGVPYNFYHDTNVYETSRATDVVQALRKRLNELILEWPDQMVLHHIRDKCDELVALHITSPVARVLLAVERLLLQSEDWEMYANRGNSLAVHRRELIDLIVRWRRLELSCWDGLLETEARDFAEGVSEWWFQLYETLIQGSDAAVNDSGGDESAVDRYLDALVPLIDDYFAKSPIGQFTSRMRMSEDFEIYVQHLLSANRTPHPSAYQRIQKILHNTNQYYSQFSASIVAHLSRHRESLEKEIKDFIKLASWKDINVQALRQSAQRTHHQLYKCIRKFREGLRQPVYTLVMPARAGEAEQKPVHYSSELSVPLIRPGQRQPPFPDVVNVTRDRPVHLVDLGQTFSRFSGLVAHELRSFIHSTGPEQVDELAVQIIVTANDLAKETVSSSLTKEKKQKHLKALFVRKKKACSNLLKELKRAGISANVNPEVLRQQEDRKWMREQPVISTPSDGKVFIGKGDTYFYRLLGLLPELRASAAGHHQDISTRELQRGISLVESGVSLALQSRTSLANILDSRMNLVSAYHRFHMILSCPKLSTSKLGLVYRILSVKDVACKLRSALKELLDALSSVDDFDDKKFICHEFQSRALDVVTRLCTSMSGLYDNIRLTNFPVLLEEERCTLNEAIRNLQLISTMINEWSSMNPRLTHLFLPLARWLGNVDLSLFDAEQDGANALGYERVDVLIDTMLLDVQAIVKLSTLHKQTYGDAFIKVGFRQVDMVSRSLHLDSVLKCLDDIVAELATSPENEVKDAVTRFLPFLEDYLALVDEQLHNHGRWTSALFKLDYILCSVMLTIANDGFCKPPETETEGEPEGLTGVGDGVGLGEGTGNEDVSKEITDESQVEGLQNEGSGDDKQKENVEKDGAIEMSDDIGGDLEDVDDSEMSDDPEDGSEDEPDEQVGSLDNQDPSAVDEKLWGDESGPQDLNSGDKTNQDHSKGDEQTSDVVAREKRQNANKEREKGEEKPDKETESGEQGLTEDDLATDDPSASGAPMEDHIQEANTLDLPEDLNLEDSEVPGPQDQESDGEQLSDDMASDGGDDDSGEVPNTHNDDVASANGEDIDEDDNQMQTAQEDEENMELSDEDQVDKPSSTQPDIHMGDGKGDELSKSSDPGAPTGSEQKDLDSQGEGEQSLGQKDAQAKSGAEAPETVPNELQQKFLGENDSKGTLTTKTGSDKKPSVTTQLSNNPLRSLGDALKEVRKNLDQILESRDRLESAEEDNVDSRDVRQLQYIRPDEQEESMQALGAAGDEQAARLSDLKLIDEEQPDESVPMDVDPITTEPAEQSKHLRPPAYQSFRNDHDTELESGLTQDQVRSHQTPLDNGAADNDAEKQATLPTSSGTKLSEDSVQLDVESRLREWQAQGYPEHDAESIWRLYESLTHDLSYALCEQLRLILEPTQATRLRGDYRSGKRLNMKKIIPYIASEYTKDKIWLRRTKPSKREYQVLICLDDSRSMAESHSVHLAYQTLALVSKALGRLEVGDIAIAKFGQTVDVLHGFNDGRPFTDQAGTGLISSLRFDQKATNVLALIDTSLQILEQARERRSSSSATAADLWQLEIIVSDGICQDHERLRTALRRAEEQHVMVVFIILDSLHSHVESASSSEVTKAASFPTGKTANADPIKNSILSMQQGVAVKNANGVMEVKMERYLDSFPFEYYVVLRDVEALPDILAGTVKQFFERISED